MAEPVRMREKEGVEEEEEEEVAGMDLKARKKSHSDHQNHTHKIVDSSSPTNSDSTITSESSSGFIGEKMASLEKEDEIIVGSNSLSFNANDNQGRLAEVEEFDVERVIQKQETHHLYCPNCKSCITKRVILKRRKRKLHEITSVEDDDNLEEENREDESISAITCLSCFSIFLPTKNGWLCRIFRKKPQVPILPEEPLPSETEHDPEDKSALWFLNCCQSRKDRFISMPLEKPDDKPSQRSTEAIPGNTEPGTRPSSDIETPLLEGLQGDPRPQEGVGVDIIKAIVYGSLPECITSLSVVSSAAAGDATTLNVVALGLANVFGGLVLLFHNLRVLKLEHGTERYIQKLGRPGHFLLHATLAIISYLIFGLLAPIVYGFSFRKSDNKDYKLIALATVSLACISVLSTAKAYVRSPPKRYIQTILYYLSAAFMASGVGYASGHLINELLKKFDLFGSGSAVPQAGYMEGV